MPPPGCIHTLWCFFSTPWSTTICFYGRNTAILFSPSPYYAHKKAGPNSTRPGFYRLTNIFFLSPEVGAAYIRWRASRSWFVFFRLHRKPPVSVLVIKDPVPLDQVLHPGAEPVDPELVEHIPHSV